MKERINRQGDEKLYQPKIHSDRIRELYSLKLLTGLPMTVLLDYAIREFLVKVKAGPPGANFLLSEVGTDIEEPRSSSVLNDYVPR